MQLDRRTFWIKTRYFHSKSNLILVFKWQKTHILLKKRNATDEWAFFAVPNSWPNFKARGIVIVFLDSLKVIPCSQIMTWYERQFNPATEIKTKVNLRRLIKYAGMCYCYTLGASLKNHISGLVKKIKHHGLFLWWSILFDVSSAKIWYFVRLSFVMSW